jgi:hypothetical protein
MRNRARPIVLIWLAAASAGCNAIYGPSPTDDNWRTRSMGHFSFYFRPDSFAEQSLPVLGDVLGDQFTTTITRLDLRYQGHITMFLHNSGADAGFGDDEGGGNHSGVAYPDTEAVKVVCVPPLDGNLFGLLSHEANHVIIRNGLGRAGTTFINEGLASAVLSERFHTQGQTFYHRWVADHRAQLPRLRDLIDDEKWTRYPQQTSYNASASFLAFVIQRYGVAPLKAVYYAGSTQFLADFQHAFGKSLDVVEADWLLFVSN